MYDPYNVFNFCKSTVKEIKNDLHILNFTVNIFYVKYSDDMSKSVNK